METKGDGVVKSNYNTNQATRTELSTESINGSSSTPPSSGSSQTPITTSTCNPKSDTILFGSKGPKVTELQTYLTQLGYGDLLGKHGPKQVGIDGIFEADTRKAVIKFQQDNHLKKIDGKVGPETWAALCSFATSSPVSPVDVCTPDDQTTNVCTPDDQTTNVCTPDDQTTNVCTPDDQTTNVCTPDKGTIPYQYQKILDK